MRSLAVGIIPSRAREVRIVNTDLFIGGRYAKPLSRLVCLADDEEPRRG